MESLIQRKCLTITRQTLWAARVGKSDKAMPTLASLPPTTEAFYENVKRAHIQACIWKHALDADPPPSTQDLNPCDYGWRKDEASNTVLAITVASNVALAPLNVLKMIKCGCTSDIPCSTLRCSCYQARLPCTIFCACQKVQVDIIQCNNEQTKHAR